MTGMGAKQGAPFVPSVSATTSSSWGHLTIREGQTGCG
jgi:hypothetical protein